MAKKDINNEPMLEETSDEILLEETSDTEAMLEETSDSEVLLEEESSESVLLEEDSEVLLEETADQAAAISGIVGKVKRNAEEKAADEERYKAARERSRKEAETERRRKAEEQRKRRAAEETRRNAEADAERRRAAEEQERKRRAEEERRKENSLREARRIAAEEERRDKKATQFLSLIGWGIGLPLILTFLMFIMNLIGLLPGDNSFSFLTYLGIFAFISIMGCFAIREDHDLVRPQLYGIIGIMVVIIVVLLWRGCSGLISGSSDDELKEKYDSIYAAGDDGLRIVSLNSKKGLIDKSGNEKLPLQYDEILEPVEKEILTTVKNGDKEEQQTRIFITRIVMLSGKKGLILAGEKRGDDFQQNVGVLFEPKHDSIYYDQENKYWSSYDRDL